MVVLTPKVTVLTGMPVGPPLSLPLRFLFSLTHTAVFFLLPPASAAVQGTQTPVQRKHGRPANTHTHQHTHLSKHGGWRDLWRVWVEGTGGPGGGGFISGGMLSVSKDTHFTHTGQKHTAHPHRRSSCLRPPSLLDHFYLSNLIYPRSRFFLIFSSFVSNLFSPLPPSCPPSHSVFCSPPHLSSPTFSGSVAPQRSVSA